MKKTNAIRILDQQGIKYELQTYEYKEDNLSVEQIAQDNQLAVTQVYKTLVAKGDKTGVIVAVIAGHHTLDFKTLAKASNNKKITLVPVKMLLQLTGYIRGGCSPIGMKKKYPVYLDRAALELEELYVNAGKKGMLVRLSVEDLQKLTDAEVF